MLSYPDLSYRITILHWTLVDELLHANRCPLPVIDSLLLKSECEAHGFSPLQGTDRWTFPPLTATWGQLICSGRVLIATVAAWEAGWATLRLSTRVEELWATRYRTTCRRIGWWNSSREQSDPMPTSRRSTMKLTGEEGVVFALDCVACL